jgi:hypothetical protein
MRPMYTFLQNKQDHNKTISKNATAKMLEFQNKIQNI